MSVTLGRPRASSTTEVRGRAPERSRRAAEPFAGLPMAQAALRFARARHAGQHREIDHAAFIDHPIEVGLPASPRRPARRNHRRRAAPRLARKDRDHQRRAPPAVRSPYRAARRVGLRRPIARRLSIPQTRPTRPRRARRPRHARGLRGRQDRQSPRAGAAASVAAERAQEPRQARPLPRQPRDAPAS